MTFCSRCAAFMLIAVSLMAGCATTPPPQLDSAHRAIKAAQQEEAATYAAQEFCQAQRALAKGQAHLRQQNTDQAIKSLEQAKRIAQDAKVKAISQKQAVQHYQQQLHQLDSETRINTLKKNLAKAETQKAACSPKQPTAPEKIAPTVTKKTTVKPKPAQPKITIYTVGDGENLYAIAAKQRVYNEGLLWPLIYRANRDQIKDPQQIYPGQQLTIPRNLAAEEIESARETARKSGIFLN